jgi:glutathione synthase/RimK-type ligase-like ATP-grasp enzyme
MILLWGRSDDPQLAAVLRSLEKHRRAVTVVDQLAPMEAQVQLVVNGKVEGWLKASKKKTDLDNITGVYARPQDPLDAPLVRQGGRGSDVWKHAIALHDTLTVCAEIAPKARVINPPSVMALDASRPWQTRAIVAAGFTVPDTLLTTDPSAVIEFRNRHEGRVVYKASGPMRSGVAPLTPERLDQLDAVRRCPVQFQEYVDGVDHRVHVVGDDVFACSIAGEEKKEVELAAADAERCVKLAKALDMQVAGIDLRRTDEGEWVCFAVTPSPAFTWFETTAGQIAERIVKLLAERRHA